LISNRIFDITILTRDASKRQFPASVKVVTIDFEDVEALASVLRGHDAVISTLATLAVFRQRNLIDAAVAAKVKRFIPSEFGSDLLNEHNGVLPVYAPKIEIQKYLQEQADAGKITYTLVFNNALLDWGLQKGFIMNLREYSVQLRDDPDRPFSTTSLRTVGKGVVGVLMHLEATKNRAVYIHDIAISQKRLLELAQALTPGKHWTVTKVDTAELVERLNQSSATNPPDPFLQHGYLKRAIWGEGHGGHFQMLDNDLLGITGITESGVSEILSGILPSDIKAQNIS
jgi:hypothetical protein